MWTVTGTEKNIKNITENKFSAYLIIRNKTITSDYSKYLNNAYTESMFIGYLQQKNERDNYTITAIA